MKREHDAAKKDSVTITTVYLNDDNNMKCYFTINNGTTRYYTAPLILKCEVGDTINLFDYGDGGSNCHIDVNGILVKQGFYGWASYDYKVNNTKPITIGFYDNTIR